ncbi:MAG: PatB family C-S lyase [Muribaculaceae bacterium]|nr:PatB family C-S lyase [Muribaculaceae bacterium]
MGKRYDFDRVIERHGTGALKTDALAERYGRPDLTPLWVADMDFATPDFIIDAMRRRLDHPVLGYTVEPSDYRPAIIDWHSRLYGTQVRPEWLCYIPGIVKGIGLAVEIFTSPGESIIIQPPVYHPFRLVPEGDGRKVVYNPLRELPEGGYAMDLDGLERLAREGAKMLIMASPHNPAGVCWDRETLARVAEICDRHGVIVISDEIHSEMVLWGGSHIPFYSVSDEARRCSITFGAPTKTFNMAGVVSSYAIVPDAVMRDKYYGMLHANELDEPHLLAPIATIAAYREGDDWRRWMLEYVEGNVKFVEEYCAEHLPGVKPLRPEASFLVWLDCRGLGLDHDSLVELFVDGARLALNDGEMFGPGGAGHMRLNIGCPRSVLHAALESLREALAGEDACAE